MNSFTLSFILFFATISTSFCWPRIQKRDAQDDAYWNDMVGSLVRDLTEEMLKKEGSFIDVDNINDTFGGKLLNGKLSATGGTIGNFSTLKFVNLSVSTTPDSLTIFVQVKLDRLVIAYSSFEASVRVLSVSGSFNAAVGSNLLTAQVTLKLDDDNDCEAALDILKLSEFGGIDLIISGVDFANEKFVNKIANMVVNKFTPELKPMAEEKLRELVLPYVALACEYWA